MPKPKNQFVDIGNARFEDQEAVMREIIASDHCPFCKENLEKYHTPAIIKETEHWILTTNKWPYKNTRVHLLAILKTHVEHLYDIPPTAGAELIEIMGWAEQEYKALGGALAMRFGDTDYSAGTISHLHAQFIVPDIAAEGYEPTRFKIGKNPRDF